MEYGVHREQISYSSKTSNSSSLNLFFNEISRYSSHIRLLKFDGALFIKALWKSVWSL